MLQILSIFAWEFSNFIRNQWGTSWGENGYMKLARNRGNTCGIASYVVYPVINGTAPTCKSYFFFRNATLKNMTFYLNSLFEKLQVTTTTAATSQSKTIF